MITATSTISSTQLGPGKHLLYWVSDNGPSDDSPYYAVSGARVFPDLTSRPEWIDFGHGAGSSAPISLGLFNDGNWASTPAQLAVFDGDPSQTNSHRVATLPVPAIAPGSFVTLTGTLNLAGLPAAATGLTSAFVQIDPDKALSELSKNNNLVLAGSIGSSTTAPASLRRIYLPFVSR